jgi:putative salt-induced outer membrane protein
MTKPITGTAGTALLSCALLLGASGLAFAQATDLTGVRGLDDRIDDIRDDVDDDLAEADDPLRYNINGVPQGWRGSIALRAAGTDGNTETADFSLGGRLTYGVGDWSHSFGVAAEYGESDGDTDQEEIFATYEGLRAFGPRVYAFGTGRFEYDDFDTVERDAFLGAGLGYRILVSETQTWRVQAGPGVRYIDLADGDDDTEAAGILSSRYFLGVTDVVSVTNDTDVLYSDANTEVLNDFGVNYRLSNNLSARASYRTEYESDPLPGFENTDNTFGVSLVVGF